MKFDSTLVGVIIVLFIFVPIIYMIVNASGKNKKIIKSFMQLAQTKEIRLTTIDVIGNTVIGVDNSAKKLVYTTTQNLEQDLKIVDLDEVKNCHAKTTKLNDKTLQWVGLEIAEKQGKREIQFYSETDESGLTKDPFMCLQDAKRWEDTLKPLLKAS